MKLYDYYQKKSNKLLTCEEVISILEKDQNQNKYLKANKKINLFADDIYKIVEKNVNNLKKHNTENSIYLLSESSLLNEQTNATYNTVESNASGHLDSSKKNNYNKKSKIKYCFTEPNIYSNVYFILKLAS